MNESISNSAMWDYLKAYAGAESAQELALLDIKEKWYWYHWELERNTFILSGSNVSISYKDDWKVLSYTWNLDGYSYDIFPLFYIDEEWREQKVTGLKLEIIGWEWEASYLSWNIVWWNFEWISWVWSFDFNSNWSKKYLDGSNNFIYREVPISDFLESSSINYLILFNSQDESLNYTLNSSENKFFTTPRLNIYSSWEIWNYKQNLKTSVDNTKFLWILKYSIYSD
jgi:hypothetical protein